MGAGPGRAALMCRRKGLTTAGSAAMPRGNQGPDCLPRVLLLHPRDPGSNRAAQREPSSHREVPGRGGRITPSCLGARRCCQIFDNKASWKFAAVETMPGPGRLSCVPCV